MKKWVVSLLVELNDERVASDFARGIECGYVQIPEDNENLEVTIDEVELG